MNARVVLAATILWLGNPLALGQSAGSPAPRVITLHEAVELALKHNHVIRIAQSAVDEKRAAKEVAKSSYYPLLRNDSTFAHLTDTQFIGFPAGGLGVIDSNLIPPRPLILNQGGLNIATSGTGLTQPLTQLLKIKAGNDVAAAELRDTREKVRGIENEVALTVHQLYYSILIAELQQSAVKAKMEASGALQQEREQQFKYGSTLEADVIESHAQTLQAKQELLSTELQLSDLHMRLNDVMGLPLTEPVALDPNVPSGAGSCKLDECVKLALGEHPEVTEAHAEVEKASAAVRLAKRDFVPDVEAFARYSYQDNVPFLARNFGTFGIHFGYDLFDGGKKRATLREREAQLAQAEQNLARINDEVELRVQTAYNKLERTRQMVAVSEELLAVRTEAGRVAAEQLGKGAALPSQAKATSAQELEAKALLLQSQLDYVQAADEMVQAIGQTPQ
jgi:outer membrane protein TolC